MSSFCPTIDSTLCVETSDPVMRARNMRLEIRK